MMKKHTKSSVNVLQIHLTTTKSHPPNGVEINSLRHFTSDNMPVGKWINNTNGYYLKITPAIRTKGNIGNKKRQL